MSKRTVIKADEELVIKGKLTVEGNVTQIETTQVVNRLESNSLVINSDGENVTAELTLNSDGTEATISFDNSDGEFNFNKPLNLGSFPLATTGNISGANIIGTYIYGNGSNISGLTTSIVSEGANLYYTVTRANNAIDARVTTAFVNALAVDYNSLSNTPINVSEFINDAGYLVAANLVSLTANVDSVNGQTGVVTLDTGDIAENGNLYFTTARANSAMDARLVGGDGIDYTAGTIAVDSTVIRTTGDQTITGNTSFVGTTSVTGSIVPTAANTYNLGSWANHFDYVFANVLHAEYLDLEDANIADIHNSFYVGSASSPSITRSGYGLTFTHNASGAYYEVNAGDGLQISGNNVAVDSTVVRTTGDQTITGNIGINGTLTVAGTINSQNVEDTYVKDTKITLNSNAAVDNTVSIEVNRPVAGANTYIKWDESTDQWKFTNNGSTEFLLPTSTTDLNEGANLYYTAARANTAMDTYLVGGAGLTYSSGTFAVGAGTGITVNADDVQLNADYVKNLISGSNGISYNSTTGALTVDSTVIRTTGDQSLANVKTFTGELIIPSSTASANGAIYYDSNTSQAFIIINGNTLELTPASLVGDVEDVGSTGFNIYAGYRELPGSSATVTQSFQGAYGKHTGNITVLSLGNTNNRFTPTVSTYDTDGFFNGNTIVIPANSTLSYAEVYGSVALAMQGENGFSIAIQILKNNVIIQTEKLQGGVDSEVEEGGQNPGNYYSVVQLSTGVIPVTANDTFELKVFNTGVGAYETNPGLFPHYEVRLLGDKSHFGIQGVLSTPSVEASKVHGIKSIAAGSYLDISDSSNVITVAGNATGIRGLISASGNISYNNTTGVISENLTTTDIDEGNNLYFTAARARGNISGSGLITYNSNTGVISTTADNYSNWNVQTGSGAGATHGVTSNSTVIISGGTGITVTNTGGNITIASTNSADIEAVSAGDGLTGGGASGAVTLNVGAGAGITVNADNVALSTSGVVAGTYGNASAVSQLVIDAYGRTTSAANVPISISASQVSDFTSATNTAIDAKVSGGAGLTYSSGVLAVGAGDGVIVNADSVEVNVAYIRNQFSALSPLSYNAAIGQFSISEVGDISEVVAGDGLTGGGTSGSVTLNIGAGTGITVNADNVALSTSGVTAGTYGSAGSVSQIVVDTYGRTTSATNVAISISASQVSDFTSAANTAIDARLIGGSGLTYGSGTLAVGAGSYILVGADDVSVDATSTNTANKVVARDSSGNFAANVITATATTARYADLAENYLGDADYEPGTVLVFGGDAEVTACVSHDSTRVAGVVTTQPAHVMNSDLTGSHVTCIALRGRVPVKVKGVVRKGDVLVTAGEGFVGYAVAALYPRDVPAASIVGKAITDKLDAGPGVVEALI